MSIDYNELERRVIEKMKKGLPRPEDDDIKSKLIDWVHEEAAYSAILVLAEYEKMKKESQS